MDWQILKSFYFLKWASNDKLAGSFGRLHAIGVGVCASVTITYRSLVTANQLQENDDTEEIDHIALSSNLYVISFHNDVFCRQKLQ